MPDTLDLDSDGDGISDAEEAGDLDRCTPARFCDSDALPDAQDLDSDGDGVFDADERAAGTDNCNVDTDADGCSDYAERVLDGCSDPDDVFLAGDCFVWSGIIMRTVPGEGAEPLGGVTLVLRDVPGEVPYPYEIRIAALDAQPVDGVSGRTSSGFTGVVPGTQVSFQVTGNVPEDDPRRPDARYVYVQDVLLLGPGGRILDESRALIIVTPGCIVVI